MTGAAATERRRWRWGALWLAAPALAFLAVFMVLPVGQLLSTSLRDAQTGSVTAAHYARLFQVDVYLRVLGITFRIAGWTALFSVLLGYPLAYWLARQPDGRRAKMLLLVLVPFWTSYLVKTFAWMIILGRRGILNSAAMDLGLIDSPLALINNEFGVMVGMVHSMLPLAVLTMLPVMITVDARLAQAAATLGAPPSRNFWLVHVPLSMPGVAAAGLLTYITSLGFFIVPALLGGRQQTMLAQLILVQVLELVNWPFAGALAALMLVTALVTCLVYDRVFGLSSLSGDTSGGASHASWLRRGGLVAADGMGRLMAALAALTEPFGGRRLGPWLLPAYVAAVLVFLLFPLIVVIPMAFTSSSFLEFPPPGYSTRWFEAYLSSPVWIGATIRSFGVAFATAALATLIGAAAAFGLARSRSRLRGLVFAALLAPTIIPRIVIAVGLYYLFAQLGLVATDLGLVIGHTLLAIPFALIAVAAVLKTYDWRLDQVAATLGASRLQVVRLVTAPLIRGGLVAGFLFAFITSFDELTVALFVSGGLKTTLPKQMWDDMIMQLNPTLAAVSVVIFIVITVPLLLAERLRRPS
ncbi:ABC transporter permease subunit [Enterovirga sp.]|uniref:ABC transporter permease subunit n=1 Tax=Enterovirga sp. TaxID=2026350 RepID=UPI002C295BA0|nr:ABC transporter permease subunit [Enterovirga sp.]HMO28039.1 ABC transporter permease subunit [Enterovirga sp.]